MNKDTKRQINREDLLKRKAAIQLEINNYPSPIAGCDQQFNHLLEQRANIRKQLKELEKQ